MQTAIGGGQRETDVQSALQTGWKIPQHHSKLLTLFLSPEVRKLALFLPRCMDYTLNFQAKAGTLGKQLPPADLFPRQQLDQVDQVLNFKASVLQFPASPTKRENGPGLELLTLGSLLSHELNYFICYTELSLELQNEFWLGGKAVNGKLR